MTTAGDCAAPDQSAPLPASVDPDTATIIRGVVRAAGQPVAGAFVRLLDRHGDFAGEVVSSAAGEFRFFARPGQWVVEALSPAGRGRVEVQAGTGVTEAPITLGG
jgi:hypothetical protein